jgi:hypothetical protein
MVGSILRGPAEDPVGGERNKIALPTGFRDFISRVDRRK